MVIKWFKKWFIIALSIFLSIFLLTGCMSMEESKKAKENVMIAKSIIQKYIKLTYGDIGKITDVECLEIPRSSGPIPDFTISASRYVKANININNKTFEVITNTETGECYDTFNLEVVKSDIMSYILKTTGVDTPIDFDIQIYHKSLFSSSGFMTHDIITMSELLQGNEYELKVTYKYINSFMDFSSINTDSFFSGIDGTSNIELIFYNFINSERYKIPYSSYYRSWEYYCLNDILYVYKEGDYDYTKKSYIYPEVATMSYCKFEHYTVNNIEFVWQSNVNDVGFIETDVTNEDMCIDGTSSKNEELTSLDGKSIIMNVKSLRPDKEFEDYEERAVYMFCDKSLNGGYLLLRADNEEDVYDLRELVWSYNSYYMDSYVIAPEETETRFTVGLYE